MMLGPALKTCDLQANEKQMESMKKEEEAKKADFIVRWEETQLILLSTKKKTFCSKMKAILGAGRGKHFENFVKLHLGQCKAEVNFWSDMRIDKKEAKVQFVKSREDFLRKKERLERKVTSLAQKLGIARNEVVAAQVELWW